MTGIHYGSLHLLLIKQYCVISTIHCVKSVQIRSFLWSLFFRIRTWKSSVFEHFSQTVNPKKMSLVKLSLSLSLHCWSISWVSFLKVIRNLDPGKAHRHSMIIIRILKLYCTSVFRHSGLIFKSCLEGSGI